MNAPFLSILGYYKLYGNRTVNPFLKEKETLYSVQNLFSSAYSIAVTVNFNPSGFISRSMVSSVGVTRMDSILATEDWGI